MDAQNTTLYRLVAAAATRHPHLPAYEFLGRQTDFSDFLSQIHRVAQGFAAMGIRSGDRVGLCLPNCPQAILGLYALNRLGAVCVMLHPLAAPRELASALDDTGTEVLLTLERLAPPIQAACRRHVTLVTVRLPGEGLPRQVPGQLRWTRLLAAGAAASLPPDRGRSSDPALLLFSGGSSGIPKAVLHTNCSCTAAAAQLLAVCGLDRPAGLRMLSLLPLFHGFGLIVGIHAPLMGGACCVLIPRFRTKKLGTLLLQTKPDLLPAVPTMLEALRTDPKLRDRDLSFLKAVYCGGDVLSMARKQRLERFFAAHGAPLSIRLGYGLTECVAAACLSPADRSGVAGAPLPGMAVCICQPGTTELLPPETEGEICLTGPTVMVKYEKQPEETAQALQRHRDGLLWLHTGDLGWLDPQGLLQFSQRLKRIIVTGGYNVYPGRLEALLLTHPLVAQVCVVGVPDSCRGQQVKAFVVPASDALTEDELRRFCANRVARYAQPRAYVFCKALPMTKLGKVDWRALETQ